MRDSNNIDTTGGNIRGNKQLKGFFPEFAHHFIPLLLGEVTMQGINVISLAG
jgi:hypothetical protein